MFGLNEGIARPLTLPFQWLAYGLEPVITVRVSWSAAPLVPLYLMATSRHAGPTGAKPSGPLAPVSMWWQVMHPLVLASLSIVLSSALAFVAGAIAMTRPPNVQIRDFIVLFLC